MWDFLFYHLPLWLQLSILAIPVAIGFWFAIQIFGWEKVRGWIAPALAVLAAFGLLSRSQQKGYADRKAQEDQALQKAEKTVDEKRQEINKLPDSEVDKRLGKW